MPRYIRIEPHSEFKRAVVKTDKDGYITYSYFKLIEVCRRINGWNAAKAREWMEYNILNMNDESQSLFGVVYEEPEVRHKVRRKVRKPRR